MTFHGQKLIITEPKQIKKPSLFIRNVRKIGHSKLVALMSQMGCDRLRINNRTRDVVSDLAIAFFPTEEAAFQALHKLKNITVEDVKIQVSFRWALTHCHDRLAVITIIIIMMTITYRTIL